MNSALNDKKKSIGFSFAWNGLKEVVKTEHNFRFHLIASCLVMILGLYLGLTKIEWAIIFLVFGLVFVAEMINSSIEKMLDYLNPTIHPQAKMIKDISAGAVLLAAIISVIIGVIIFLPKLSVFFN